jgi:hypothetical protein
MAEKASLSGSSGARLALVTAQLQQLAEKCFLKKGEADCGGSTVDCSIETNALTIGWRESLLLAMG